MPEKEHELPRYTTELYFKGFRILLTQPYENASSIVGTMNQLIEAGFSSSKEVVVYQAEEKPAPQTPAKQEVKETPPGFCPVHNVEMRKFEKNGRSWYSHKNGEGWCNGKQK